MPKFKLLVIFVISFYISKGQDAFRITYERFYGQNKNNSNTGSSIYFTKVVFNDSLFFCYHYYGNKDAIKDDELYGNKILHHAEWYNIRTDELYDGVAWPNPRKPYLVKGKPISRNWIIDTATSHFYQNYRCKKAYTISEPGDTLFVIYTNDIPTPYGYYVNKGLPGAMLEFYNSKYDLYVRAIKVEKGKFLIGMPKDPKISDHFIH